MRLSVFLLLITFILTACTVDPLKDNVTKQDINIINSVEGMNVYSHRYDNMDRGHHEFDGFDIVVDQTYYKSNDIQRGEIVFYKNPKLDNSKINLSENEISRIIALPGEKIRIDKGQIYIDRRKLDTFYGQAHRLGMNIEKLQEAANQSDLADSIRNNFSDNANDILKSKETNLKEIKVPDEHYFIVGDDWFRSADSRHFGTIPKDNILGMVLGVVKK
ncbi:signal peptidase I [Paenibacillus sp. GCM10023248]|uniref:signal peptidase I n=1 Tax=Bacillales TaxID=1385 RepID=UPI0023794045|nr:MULTISPECIES: signal peptidase I [Bacillales]MDD9269611.1 signal peptidase I [Paenibacillus sp. MAHUQ-63]MDR6880755.1 signal peptidase I [Bacillus sp. 3255]